MAIQNFFPYIIYAFYSWYNTVWIANTEIVWDPNNSVIKRLWWSGKPLKFAWIEYAASFFLHLMTWKHGSFITAKFFLDYENCFTFFLGLHIDLAVCKPTLYSKKQFLEYGHFQIKWLQSVTLGVKIQHISWGLVFILTSSICITDSKMYLFMPPRPRSTEGIERSGCLYVLPSVDQVKVFVQTY